MNLCLVHNYAFDIHIHKCHILTNWKNVFETILHIVRNIIHLGKKNYSYAYMLSVCQLYIRLYSHRHALDELCSLYLAILNFCITILVSLQIL